MTTERTSYADTTGLHSAKTYRWTPQPDITAYELAINLPYFFGSSGFELEDFLVSNPDCARHWTEHK